MLKIECAADVAIVLNAAVDSHKEQWNKIDNIEDYIIRARQPWTDEELKEAGYSWCANFNYGKGKALVEKNVGLNTLSIMASLAFMDVTFNSFDKKKHKKKVYLFLEDPRLRCKFSFALSLALAETLEWDPDFYSFVSKIENECFCFGHCSVTRDPFSYLGVAHKVREIAYEDRTTFSNPQCWLTFDIIKAEFLYRQYLKFKDNNTNLEMGRDGVPYHVYESGWVKEGLLEVFKDALNKKKDGDKELADKDCEPPVETWENIEALIAKEGYTAILTNIKNLYVVKVYQIDEQSNFWETYAVTKTDPLQRGVNVSLGVNKYILYKKKIGRVEADEILNTVRDFGINSDDTIASLKGNGKYVAEDSIRFDIKKCRIEDKLTFAGSPVFKETNSIQGKSLKLAVGGGFVFIPQDAELSGQQFTFDLSQHMQSIQLDEQNFGRETAHIDPTIQGKLSSRPSTSEVQAQSSEVSRQKMAKVPIKNADYAVLFRNIIKDLGCKTFLNSKPNKARQIFFDHLKDELSEEEITEDDLKLIVKEVKLIHLEPVNTDINAIQAALGIVDSTESRRNLYRMYLIALGFSRKQANEFIKYQDYGLEMSIAALENASFYTTSEIAFGGYQDHITHLNTHYAKCDRVLEGIAQGEDIEQGFNFFVNCLTNTEKHVNALQGISFYKKKFKEFLSIQKYYESKAQEIATLVQKIKNAIAAKAQGQEQGQDGQQALDPKTQASIYNDRIKTVEKIKRTEEQSRATMQRKNKELEFKLGEHSKKTQASIETQKQLAEVKRDLELLRASVQASAAQQKNATNIAA